MKKKVKYHSPESPFAKRKSHKFPQANKNVEQVWRLDKTHFATMNRVIEWHKPIKKIYLEE